MRQVPQEMTQTSFIQLPHLQPSELGNAGEIFLLPDLSIVILYGGGDINLASMSQKPCQKALAQWLAWQNCDCSLGGYCKICQDICDYLPLKNTMNRMLNLPHLYVSDVDKRKRTTSITHFTNSTNNSSTKACFGPKYGSRTVCGAVPSFGSGPAPAQSTRRLNTWHYGEGLVD